MTKLDFANHLKSLDELIASSGGADFGTQTKGSGKLLMEHLQAARREFMGSMPNEYSLSMREALSSVDCIRDERARTEIKKSLHALSAVKN